MSILANSNSLVCMNPITYAETYNMYLCFMSADRAYSVPLRTLFSDNRETVIGNITQQVRPTYVVGYTIEGMENLSEIGVQFGTRSIDRSVLYEDGSSILPIEVEDAINALIRQFCDVGTRANAHRLIQEAVSLIPQKRNIIKTFPEAVLMDICNTYENHVYGLRIPMNQYSLYRTEVEEFDSDAGDTKILFDYAEGLEGEAVQNYIEYAVTDCVTGMWIYTMDKYLEAYPEHAHIIDPLKDKYEVIPIRKLYSIVDFC